MCMYRIRIAQVNWYTIVHIATLEQIHIHMYAHHHWSTTLVQFVVTCYN